MSSKLGKSTKLVDGASSGYSMASLSVGFSGGVMTVLHSVCHQLLLLVNSTPHWLAGRACRFHLQGVTAVVHGW